MNYYKNDSSRIFFICAFLVIIFILFVITARAENNSILPPRADVQACKLIDTNRVNKWKKRKYRTIKKLNIVRDKSAPNKPSLVTKPICIKKFILLKKKTFKYEKALYKEYKDCAKNNDSKCHWLIKWRNLPVHARSWTNSTGACESGNNAKMNNGNGFYGAFQFIPSTWHSAGGSGMPHEASWYEQAVRAWNWHLGHPSGQWPVCGE